MRSPLALVAIAALAAAWCVPAASDEAMELPTRAVRSPDGKPVEIRVLVPQPGIFTLLLPPDICTVPAEAPAQQPRAPASSSRRLQI